MRNRRLHQRKQRGFVLIAMSAAMLLMLGLVGMAFDFGRIYIARNEAQLFTDAAALAAAQRLDGTAAGVGRAKEAVARLRN
jgi:Flp pilus assembly protein TadG